MGRIPLLLLDSDIEENDLIERGVTDRLYGGGSEHRLLQEMLLGIGGVRAVRTYCRLTGHAAPEVFHTNEGHAGFLGLERMAELRAEGLDFDAALEAVRAGTVFTTHTPVLTFRHRPLRPRTGRPALRPARGAAGPGRRTHPAARPETYPGGEPNLFNMAVMGLRLAQRANGVSLLHGQVSRETFAGLWPGFDPEEVPITSVTNGVHAPTWVAPEVYRLGARQIGTQRAEEALSVGDSDRWDSVADIPDQDIWDLRRSLRELLVLEVRERLRASWRQRGAATAELGWIDGVLDPDVLTIGFARRVPSYKRLTLMLRDRDRLMDLLLHPDRPVQIVVAGKAHPADDGGKRLIQELVRFADDPRVRHRIVFLPDYGMAMAQKLYPGCDIWLNNPLRPLEACGTSGMKAALNGGLNLSVLDGWWDEWFQPDFGWAIPTADGVGTDADRRDDIEAAALYDLLEQRVTRAFYERGRSGLPDRWIEMVRRTLSLLGPEGAGRAHGAGVRGAALHACRARAPGDERRRRPGARRMEGDGTERVARGDRRPRRDVRGLGHRGTGQHARASGAGGARESAAGGRGGAGGRGAGRRGGSHHGCGRGAVEAGGGARGGGRVGLRGPAVPGPDGAVRLHGAGAAQSSPAGVGRGAGPAGGPVGGRGGGSGPSDALSAPAGGRGELRAQPRRACTRRATVPGIPVAVRG